MQTTEFGSAEEALERFLQPPAPLRNLKREEAITETARRFPLTVRPGIENPVEELTVYRWGKASRRILLIHGWGGKAVQYFALIEALVAAGLEVVAFDAPAHGTSSGQYASVPAFANSTVMVARVCGELHGIVGHSLGGAAAMLALCRGLRVDRLALLAPLYFVGELIDEFIEARRLRDPWATQLRGLFDARYRNEINAVQKWIAGSRLEPKIFHDPADPALAFANGEAFYRALPGSELIRCPGLGHWKILRDRGIALQLANFFDRTRTNKSFG